MRFAEGFLQNIGRKSSAMETFENSPDTNLNPSTSSAAVTPVNPSAKPENAPANRILGIFGRNLLGSFGFFDREACYWKTSQDTFLSGLDRYSETWPDSGTMQNGRVFELRTLERPTCENGFSSWPTVRATSGGGNRSAYPGAPYRPAIAQVAQCCGESCGNHPGSSDSLTGVSKLWRDAGLSADGRNPEPHGPDRGRPSITIARASGTLVNSARDEQQRRERENGGMWRRGIREAGEQLGDSSSARFAGTENTGASRHGENEGPRGSESQRRDDCMANAVDGLVQESGRRSSERNGSRSTGEIFPDSRIAVFSDSEQTELSESIRNQEGRTATELCGAFAPGPADERWRDIIRERPDLAPALESPERSRSAKAETKSSVRGMADGLPDWMVEAMSDRTKRLSRLGNAVVPQIAEYIGRRIISGFLIPTPGLSPAKTSE